MKDCVKPLRTFSAVFAALSFLAVSGVSCGPVARIQQAEAKAESPKFQKRKIQLGKKTILVEIADSYEKRQHGLMFRESLPEDQGMLFIFEDEQPLSFWMKNTLIPLSIGYFDKNKKLIEVLEMVPALAGEAQPRSYPGKRPAMYALEMNKGWFSRNKIEPGTTFDFVVAK